MAKRWSILVVVLVLLLAIAPMDALGKKKKKKKPPPPPVEQVVEGDVMFLARTVPGAQADGCFAGIHRRALLVFGDQSQGYFGYNFDLDPATIGGNFVLEVAGGQAEPDLDITFYSDFGGPNTDPAATITYENRGAGGEEGAIPPDMKHVIVCMYTGFESTFKYTGTGPTGGAPAPNGSPAPSGSPTPSPTSN